MFFILLSFESCHLLYRILMIKDDVLNSIDLVLCGCDQHQDLIIIPLLGEHGITSLDVVEVFQRVQ